MALVVIPKKLNDIATWMGPLEPTLLPEVLRGIFFMDGNPLPDHCLTMHRLEWNEKTLSLIIPVAAPLQWTFHHTLWGRALLLGAYISRFRYKVQFEDESLQQAQVIPISFGIPVPKWMVNATMLRDDQAPKGEVWLRKNIWFGGLPRVGEYVMRRVVDEKGEYTPAFDEMLKKVDPDCWVVAPQTPSPKQP